MIGHLWGFGPDSSAMASKPSDKQVVSKQRVVDHGEVYTGAREVNAMLDLVRQETERIDSRFLEPACGTGNFLAEILTRKLGVVAARYGRSQFDYERYAVLAVGSVYGIDILADNVAACRQRLFTIFDAAYTARFKRHARDEMRASVRFVLGRNVIHGDALTLKTAGDNPQPIVFSEWSLVTGGLFKRRDFTFHELLHRANMKALPLYAQAERDVFIPEPVAEFPLTHFLQLSDTDG